MRKSIPSLTLHLSDPPPDSLDCFFDRMPTHPNLPLIIRREYGAGGVHAGPHRHVDFFALYVVRGGRGVHRIDGTPYGIVRGDVYMMAPGSTHGYLDYKDLVIDGFYFPFSLLEPREADALRELRGFWRLFVTGGEANIERRLHLSPTTHKQIETQIEELRDEWVKDSAAALCMLRSGFFRLLITLARLHAGAKAETGEETGQALRRSLGRHQPFGRDMELADVRRWCEENRGEMPSVSQLASMMWLSPSQFRAVWKRETGVAPAIYLRRLRLERARTQLDEARLSVTQVARDAGFADAAHFSRAFRAVYGQSPRQYRQSRR